MQVEGRRALLREITLGVLADLPDDLVRTTLRRWIDADDADLDARIALLHRITIQPRDADPDRLTLLSELESIVVRSPSQISAREVLVTALADSGEPEGADGFCSRIGRLILEMLVTGDCVVAGIWNTITDPEMPLLHFARHYRNCRRIGDHGIGWPGAFMFLVARMKALRLPKLSAAFVRRSIR